MLCIQHTVSHAWFTNLEFLLQYSSNDIADKRICLGCKTSPDVCCVLKNGQLSKERDTVNKIAKVHFQHLTLGTYCIKSVVHIILTDCANIYCWFCMAVISPLHQIGCRHTPIKYWITIGFKTICDVTNHTHRPCSSAQVLIGWRACMHPSTQWSSRTKKKKHISEVDFKIY